MVDSLYYSSRKISERCETLLWITEYITKSFVIHYEGFELTQWVSSNLSWFASLNNKAFGNLFCNSEKSFHTSPRSSDSNNRGYRPFFKLNNGICIYKKILGFFVNANDIVEFEEWSIASIIRVGISRRGVKLFCELQNILPKALLFITKDLNWPNGSVQIFRDLPH